MLSASLYIILCSARNRLRQRLRRLREPRYLIGAIVGAAYIYFSFFARRQAVIGSATRRRATARPPLQILAAMRTAVPGVVGIALMALTAFGWVLPFDSGLLEFSDPEIQFLFPAPVSRRGLLIHRLLRSQLGLLFGSLVAGLLAPPSLSGTSRVRIAIGMWILLTTGKVYFTGISLARARLTSTNARVRSMAWLPVVVLSAALAVVGRAALRAFDAPPISVQDFIVRLGGVTASGVSSIVLWPFIALARPLLAEWPGPYLRGLASACAVLAGCIVWVLQSDATFEDAAATASQRRTEQVQQRKTPYARSASLPLAPAGRPELAFAWKAATQTFRAFGGVAMIRTAAVLTVLAATVASTGRARDAAAIAGTFALACSVGVVVLGPQMLRIDMREDLRHLEALKTWPVRAAAVVRGEMLWPGALLTALAWGSAALAETIAGQSVFGGLSAAWRFSVGAAFAVLAPGLVFAQLTIHNAAALMFPAWVPLGYQRPRGLDALGQRLIMLFGTWIVLIVSALPGAFAGAIVWFVLARVIGAASIVPAAAVCSAALAIEVLLATEALGPAYESVDLSAVERGE